MKDSKEKQNKLISWGHVMHSLVVAQREECRFPYTLPIWRHSFPNPYQSYMLLNSLFNDEIVIISNLGVFTHHYIIINSWFHILHLVLSPYKDKDFTFSTL